ncbi:hypothetical protein DEA8626_03072 [Defluviimonas aquaemixtae]|uniref:Cytochrome c domain-containing protein n=1 Tax=Albidovulum aquaemixtae TaxID=1542388 RepID=A0A2R8BKZ4_9RHOB|nr:hypothetical protein [Defluviimonas aquaemixtae]SPH24024.1 hypothetical protein DEA8626_03072 [Defluviimonas aquaemixtae]
MRSIFHSLRLAATFLTGLAAVLLSLPSQVLEAGELPTATSQNTPATLFETGLYSDPVALIVDPGHIAFTPQYPLWTDGAEKRRWISLPAGSAIDASDPDAWDFPVGTRFWKEFSFDGKKVETRYMQRLADGTWLFASYGWSENGRSAELVPEKGRKGAYPLGDGRSHAIPAAVDCRICHLSGPVPVLGFSARQLATDEDPGAVEGDPTPHLNRTLDAFVARGTIAGLDDRLRWAQSPGGSRLERAALGYLHGNCGHCHNRQGPLAGLGLDLRQSVANPQEGALASAVGWPLKSPPPGLVPGTGLRIAPGHPQLSAIPQRMASRTPALQMPPLGTTLGDAEGIALINRWIAEMETVSTEAQHKEGEEK